MAEDLSNLWRNFSLSEGESLEVEATEQEMNGLVTRGSSCLVGKLIAEHIVGKDTIKATLLRGWRPSGQIVFKVLGANLFLLDFEHVWDKAEVLHGRPWVFEGNLFSVEDFNGSIAPAKMEFDKAFFWVRMFHLPLGCMSEAMGVKLGSSVGQVEEVETDEDGIGWGEYLRVRICLDISKPLVRERVLKLNGETTWVAFQYERLPRFCFQCGIICHGEGGCIARRRKSQGPHEGVQFGPWLRVSPMYKQTGFERGGHARLSASIAIDQRGLPGSSSGEASDSVVKHAAVYGPAEIHDGRAAKVLCSDAGGQTTSTTAVPDDSSPVAITGKFDEQLGDVDMLLCTHIRDNTDSDIFNLACLSGDNTDVHVGDQRINHHQDFPASGLGAGAPNEIGSPLVFANFKDPDVTVAKTRVTKSSCQGVGVLGPDVLVFSSLEKPFTKSASISLAEHGTSSPEKLSHWVRKARIKKDLMPVQSVASEIRKKRGCKSDDAVQEGKVGCGKKGRWTEVST
jgi:hypothetical protein